MSRANDTRLAAVDDYFADFLAPQDSALREAVGMKTPIDIFRRLPP